MILAKNFTKGDMRFGALVLQPGENKVSQEAWDAAWKTTGLPAMCEHPSKLKYEVLNPAPAPERVAAPEPEPEPEPEQPTEDEISLDGLEDEGDDDIDGLMDDEDEDEDFE